MSDLARQSHDFPKSKRLLTSRDFQNVFQQVAVKAGTAELFLLASPSVGSAGARLGFIIARKQVKKAVDRNRLKRIWREEFRMLHNDYPDLDIIVMTRKGAHQLSRQAVHKAARYLLQKLKKRYQPA